MRVAAHYYHNLEHPTSGPGESVSGRSRCSIRRACGAADLALKAHTTRHTIIRWTRCAVGSAALLIPLALAVAACSRKDAGEDTGAVTSATTESAGGSTARAPAAGVDAGAGAALDKAMVSSIPPSCTVVMV